jgi:signal transduction histidine kinase
MPDPFTFHPQDVHLLDIFAHDLRTPLLGVQGCLDEIRHVVADSPVGAELAEDLADARSGLSRVEELLAGLLTLCRRSRPQLSPEEIDMSTLLDAIVPRIEARHGPLSLLRDPLPSCHADRAAIAEVFTHLLEHAARRGGAIHISGQADERVRYVITDTGGALSEEQQRRAFDLFATRTHDDDGIGLSLARHLLILHRGWLRLHGTAEGCRIELSLPM